MGNQQSQTNLTQHTFQDTTKKYERFHGRVLSWIPAQPVSMADAELLAAVYAPDVQIDKELLAHIVELAHGSVRRVTVNLVNLAEAAAVNGYESADMGSIAKMQGFEFYKGEVPKRGVRV